MSIEDLLTQNREWVRQRLAENPQFFSELADIQRPDYLWIGCSDSRVPANEIVGLRSGELFVHRNIANVAIHSDISCLSVLQYAVERLQVKHIIVCGHYGCGGVKAALESVSYGGVLDNWVRHIRDIHSRHEPLLRGTTPESRLNRLCELNVHQQALNVAYSSIAQEAWKRGQELAIHGFIYDIADGVLKKLDVEITSQAQVPRAYRLDPLEK